ncbi:MAG: sulfatase-like hydrolase/transferase [Thermomicrobiales bacterium]
MLAFLLLTSSVIRFVGQQAAARATDAPDIVFVLSDDMNSDDWRSLPRTSALLNAAFPNYINTDALCCPSRASILTGLYPHNHGTWFIDPVPGGGGGWASFQDRETATIATMLHKAGYRTALIGKYLNNYKLQAGKRPGWDYWFAFDTPPRYYRFQVSEGSKVRTIRGYSTDVVASKAQAFVRSSSGSAPIFAYIAPKPPHAPPIPPKRYAEDCRNEPLPAMDKPSFRVPIVDGPPYLQSQVSEAQLAELVRFDQKRQCALKALDDLIVDVHAALEKRGRPYYLFVASDNGYLLGEHGGVGKRAPYDESTRTMMRATSGGGAPAITGSDHLVANIDWMATFAELSGATPPYQTDGQSLLTGPARELVVIEGEEAPSQRSGRSGEWAARVGESYETPSFRGLHVATGELYVEYADGFVEYYAADDPYRLRNARSDDPERVSELAALLQRYRDCRAALCP